MYNWGLIDGNFFLRRNFNAAKFSKSLLKPDGYKKLAASFLSTVFNYRDQFDFKKIIIAWDKTPYKKLETIKEYKQNRIYRTDADVEKLKEQIALAKDEKEKEKLIKKLKKIKYDSDCEKVFHHAKNSLLKNLEGTRIHCLRLSGYEADDIAYLFGKQIEGTQGRGILISVDGDWSTFLNPNLDYFKETLNRKARTGKLLKYEECELKDKANFSSCTLYELGILREIFTGGHNNVKGFNFKYEKGKSEEYNANRFTLEQFAKSVKCFDSNLPDYEECRKYFEALNINNYDNTEINEMISSCLEDKEESEIDDKKAIDYFKYISAFNIINKYNSLKISNMLSGEFLL